MADGIAFKSETDTEVIAQLIGKTSRRVTLFAMR